MGPPISNLDDEPSREGEVWLSLFEDVALPSPLAHSWPSGVVAVHHSQLGIASIFCTTRAFGGGDPGGGGGGGVPGGGGGGGGVVLAVGGCPPGPALFAGVAGLPPQPIRMKTQKTLSIDKGKKVFRVCTKLETQRTFQWDSVDSSI